MTRAPERSWRPRLLDPASPRERAAIAAFADDPQTVVMDTMAEQIDELVHTRHPAMACADRAELRAELAPTLDRWVYFPWSRALVRTLPAAELREVRLSRNRDKITAREQARLADRTIAVVGLSVGRSIARTVVMEGVAGRLRLADPDTLALSNLNRLPAGIHDLGLSKAVLAARELFEIDPYLDIEIFPDGVDPAALDDFLFATDRAPDLVIEECDDLVLKIRLRQRLRDLGIPIVMESSVRGTLDVERYDLEPGRPILHGLLEGVEPGAEPGLDDIKALITRILPHMSTRMRRSIARVGHTLCSWPQLASEIALGAATATMAARKILLGEPMDSGRYIVDLDRWLAPPSMHASCVDPGSPTTMPTTMPTMMPTEAGWLD